MESETERQNDYSDAIRRHIRPFPRECRYSTGWNGEMTFAEIRDALMPNLNRLMRYYRRVDVDIPDMIQDGFMRLWQELSENPALFADTDHGGAVKWVLNRTGASRYRRWFRREMYIEDHLVRDNDPDEMQINGLGTGYHEGYAHFTRAVDLRLDICRAVEQCANKYQDSQPHLAALYYITTSVQCEDAAMLAERGGKKRNWWLTSVVKPVREELYRALDRYPPKKIRWQDKFDAGNDVPFLRVLSAYKEKGDERMCTTLTHLQEGKRRKDLMQELDIPMSTVGYLRRVAYRELDRVYGCGVG
ncbi:MAG: hypothetical protein AAF846_05650 [Chloroflexota bacterium]